MKKNLPNFKKIISTDFKKMLPRFPQKKNLERITNFNYSPNYNSILTGIINFKPINILMKQKFNKLRKIITIYNPPKEYILFPELNKN